jgi:1-aminocyclopropane-1-carboxylate deaminase/D-cysteine desulfhydrase-like pyridoxal-dependent ACC family enzyme
MAISAPPIPRVELAYAPTPLLKLERLSAEVGVELWVKRDDLTGLLETGNKIRKLEFLVGEALAQNADTLITCGTLQSNCCRCVSAVAARLGLRAVLALKGAPPAEYDGNLLLDRLLGAEITYCSDAEWRKIDEVLQDLAARERAAGRVPYVIPESGATVVGALGYLACGQELAEQVRHGAPAFDTVVITAFSGGSQAGLLMAKQLAGLRADIVGRRRRPRIRRGRDRPRASSLRPPGRAAARGAPARRLSGGGAWGDPAGGVRDRAEAGAPRRAHLRSRVHGEGVRWPARHAPP